MYAKACGVFCLFLMKLNDWFVFLCFVKSEHISNSRKITLSFIVYSFSRIVLVDCSFCTHQIISNRISWCVNLSVSTSDYENQNLGSNHRGTDSFYNRFPVVLIFFERVKLMQLIISVFNETFNGSFLLFHPQILIHTKMKGIFIFTKIHTKI